MKGMAPGFPVAKEARIPILDKALIIEYVLPDRLPISADLYVCYQKAEVAQDLIESTNARASVFHVHIRDPARRVALRSCLP